MSLRRGVRLWRNLLVVCLLTASFNVLASEQLAWSEQLGWIDANKAGCPMTIVFERFEGCLWSSKVGWIRLGGDATKFESEPWFNDSNTDWGVNYDFFTPGLEGYAWNDIIGWIEFRSATSQVTYNTESFEFGGYAWNEQIGWISLSGDSYGVSMPDSDGDGVVDPDDFCPDTPPGSVLGSISGCAITVPYLATITRTDTEDGTIILYVTATDGGGTISSFQATCTSEDGSDTQTGVSAISPVRVSGLTNGVPYNCTSTASNEAGPGNGVTVTSITPEAISTGLPIWLLYESTK
ncbi:MAG: hypothetical protein AB8B57_02760 [Congregibacter sp.]